MNIKEAKSKNKDSRLPKVLIYEDNVYFNTYRILGKDISLRFKNKEVEKIKNCSVEQIKEFVQIFNSIAKRK